MWDKIQFGSNEMDQLGTIRVKLISHKTSLTLFLDTIQLRESGKMATTLEDHSEQLDMILDKVDAIAARMSQKSGGSVMSTYSDDDKEVWKDFRRELVTEGFSSSVLQKHKVEPPFPSLVKLSQFWFSCFSVSYLSVLFVRSILLSSMPTCLVTPNILPMSC